MKHFFRTTYLLVGACMLCSCIFGRSNNNDLSIIDSSNQKDDLSEYKWMEGIWEYDDPYACVEDVSYTLEIKNGQYKTTYKDQSMWDLNDKSFKDIVIDKSLKTLQPYSDYSVDLKRKTILDYWGAMKHSTELPNDLPEVKNVSFDQNVWKDNWANGVWEHKGKCLIIVDGAGILYYPDERPKHYSKWRPLSLINDNSIYFGESPLGRQRLYIIDIKNNSIFDRMQGDDSHHGELSRITRP